MWAGQFHFLSEERNWAGEKRKLSAVTENQGVAKKFKMSFIIVLGS